MSPCRFLLPLLCAISLLFPQLLPANELEVRGRVTDTEGASASGVTVMLEITDMRIRRQVGYDQTETGLAGEFTFDLSEHQDIPRFGLQFNTLSPRHRESLRIIILDRAEFPAEVELTVEPGSLARGIVTDDEGTPLPEVQVFVQGARPVTTDEQGRFELPGLPLAGRTIIRARKEGYAAANEMVQLDGSGTLEGVQIVLTPATGLSGTVLDPLDRPVFPATVVVTIGERNFRERTERDGAFAFRNLPVVQDELEIDLYAERFLFTSRPLTDDERESRDVTLRVHWPVMLKGTVLSPAGEPLAAADIFILSDDRSSMNRINADSDGSWQAGPFLPGQDITIACLPPDFSRYSAAGELDILEETESGRWRGEVREWPAGHSSTLKIAREGSRVTMERHDNGGGLPGIVRYTGTLNETATFLEGTLEVPSLGARGTFQARPYTTGGTLRGTWEIRERLEEAGRSFAPLLREVRTAPFPGTQYVDSRLSEGLTLSGRVLRGDGRAAIDGTVTVIEWEGMSQIQYHRAPITAGGAFHLEGLPEGLLILSVNDEDNRNISPPIRAFGGMTDIEIYINPDDDPMDSLDEL